MEPYSLYHTLNGKLPTTKFTSNHKKDLLKRLSSIDETGKEAVLMLICEHARIHDQFVYSENLVLPYGGAQKGKDTVFSLEKLPVDIRWILIKFLNVICKTSH